MYCYYDSRRYSDPYKDYDWDNDGFPGEYVYGPGVTLDEYYQDELWKRCVYFPDYWVSTHGRLYSTISDRFVYGSPGKKGHVDLSLRIGKRKYRAYMHRLVAEAFIPNPLGLPLVRHLDDDPSNNYVYNLAWGTQLDNMRDCIEHGRFRYFTNEDIEAANKKRRTPVTAVDLRTGLEINYVSQQEAARDLRINQACINDVLCGRGKHAKGYYFYFTNDPRPVDIDVYSWSRHNYPIKAIDLENGDVFIFGSQTEAGEALDISIASISNVLSGKRQSAKGYVFEYLEEEIRDE